MRLRMRRGWEYQMVREFGGRGWVSRDQAGPLRSDDNHGGARSRRTRKTVRARRTMTGPMIATRIHRKAGGGNERGCELRTQLRNGGIPDGEGPADDDIVAAFGSDHR